MVKSKVSELRKQALKDFNYIHTTYGVGQSHDCDEDRLIELLENPSEKVAFKILVDYIREYFEDGYYSSDTLTKLPKDNEVLNNIKERWDL